MRFNKQNPEESSAQDVDIRRAAFGMRDAEAPQPHHLILDSHW